MMKRFLFDVALLVAVFYSPWWLSFFLIAIGVFKFPFYAEAIVFGVILDLLYGTISSYGIGIVGLILALGIFLVMIRVKSAVRPAYRK